MKRECKTGRPGCPVIAKTALLVALVIGMLVSGAAAAADTGLKPGVSFEVAQVVFRHFTNVGTATFGPALSYPRVRGKPILVDDGVGVRAPIGSVKPGEPRTDDGCQPLVNGPEIAGAVAFVTRGTCEFVTKVKNAQNAGAVAVIVVDLLNDFGSVGGMAGTDPSVLIPSIMVNLATAENVLGATFVGVGLVDTLEPVIVPTVTGTLGSNGWYTSDVRLLWGVTEPDSPTTLRLVECVDQTITVDQLAQSYDCFATSEGGSGSQVVTIKRDASAPSDALVVTGTAGSNGWYTSDVSVAWNWTDAVSGIDPSGCAQVSGSSGEGSALAVSSFCQDLAGNAASDSRTFKIDKSAPTVNVTNVTDGAQYVLGSVPAAGCSTTDDTSGVAQAASVAVTIGSNGVGSVTATCSGAADTAGNPAPAVSASYSIAYAFGGFFSPVDNPPVLNLVKAGQAIPVKFSLGGNQGLNIFAAGSPASQQVACDSSAPVDGIEETVSAGSSSLSYDAASGRYSYVWKTDKSWAGTCRQLTLRLADGTSHNANFMFR